MPGFKLINITLDDSPEYDTGSYQFTGINDPKRTMQLTTLIIGPNGTGKSRLLKIIIDIFNDLYNLKTDGNVKFKFDHYYLLTYEMGGKEFVIENKRSELRMSRNGRVFKELQNLLLPTKGIVAAYSLHEKFTPKRAFSNKTAYRNKSRYDNDFYEYLGVKTERNYTFSGSNINKSLDLITVALAEDGFKKDLKHVFDLLDLTPVVVIEYKVKNNRELFTNLLERPGDLANAINSISYQNSFSYSTLSKIQKGDPDFLREVADSITDIREYLNEKFSYKIELVFDNQNVNSEFKRRYKSLSLLKSLGLLNYGEIIVFKKIRKSLPQRAEQLLRNMSSGEIHILTSMLSLSAVVEKNSLVIIDEPEISLHPNWQIRFVEVINNIFKRYKDCHFIIASHSHFLVSDLSPDSAAIMVLSKDKEQNIHSDLLDFNTYGWSAENVLYNVFGVVTSRNHYFEMELRHMLHIMSSASRSPANLAELRRTIEKFRKFNITPNDPLRLLLNQAEKYAAENQ